MLYILGMIGKGLGIALLCILILVVAMLLAVLFVPIRYSLRGKREEAGAPEGKIRVCWLFSIVSCFATWKGGIHFGLKLCGIPVYDNLKQEQKKKNREQKKDRKQKKERKQSREKTEEVWAGNDTEPVEAKKQEPQSPAMQSAKESRGPGADGAGQKITPCEETSDGGTERIQDPPEEKAKIQKKKKLSISQKARAVWQKICSFFRSLERFLQKLADLPKNISEKVNALKEKAEGYIAFLQRDDFQRALSLCKKQLFSLWKSVRPKKIRADIHFGFADPSVTGQVLAFVGMIYPLLGKHVLIRPDFEQVVCSGTIVIKGRIILFSLLRVICILYFNKDIKRLIRVWKKEEALHGRQ
ncbi:MAG: DUF2953 domain-containing protein [Lachnospiraceae bacterium]|nr:DUF2953 domain-containing protein [Lachnospiraceae bacterium]